jgi:hypothetical protein
MPPSNAPASVLTCLKAHLDAENLHDLPAIMATYTASPRVTINGQVFAGTEAVHAFHHRFGFGGAGAFSEVTVKERARHICGLVIAIEQTLSGVHTGHWQRHQPTGRRFELPVCTVYTFTPEAQLSSEDVYFDSMLIQRQLGLTNVP